MTAPTPTAPHWQRAAGHYTHLLSLTRGITYPQARRLLWEAIRMAVAGSHEVEVWHVVEAYESIERST